MPLFVCLKCRKTLTNKASILKAMLVKAQLQLLRILEQFSCIVLSFMLFLVTFTFTFLLRARWAHKASVQHCHSTGSFATCLAWFHDDHPMLFLSVSAVLLQLTLGHPIFLFPSGAKVIATWQWSSLSLLSMWPSQSHLRFRTSLLISLPLLLLSSSLLLTTFGQKTL